MLSRLGLLLVVALPLLAVDLAYKAFGTTPVWAYHPRGTAWVVLSAAVVAGCLALTRVPSRAVALTAAPLAAAAAGNGIAAVAWSQGIPNPIVFESASHVAAFNLADVFALVGIVLLGTTLSTVSIRNRAKLIPPRRFVRALRQRLR